jgi:hypothetical protein
LVFVAYGLFTLGVGVLWGILARKCGSPAPDQGPGIYAVFRRLFGVRNVQALLIMALLAFAIGHGFSSWLPNILEKNGMTASQAGFAASIPLATGIPAILLIPRFVPSRLRGFMIAIFGLRAVDHGESGAGNVHIGCCTLQRPGPAGLYQRTVYVVDAFDFNGYPRG